MARLIDAEIAIKELRTFCFDCAIHPYHGRCAKCGIGNALDIVNGISTVDAVEVVHGEWIECKSTDFRDNDNFFKCSICGRIERKQEPYCNCGAKMEKK